MYGHGVPHPPPPPPPEEAPRLPRLTTLNPSILSPIIEEHHRAGLAYQQPPPYLQRPQTPPRPWTPQRSLTPHRTYTMRSRPDNYRSDSDLENSEKYSDMGKVAISTVDGIEPEPLKRDKHGFALYPQPLDDPNDPLNWNRSKKLRILIQISLQAFLAKFSTSAIAPAIYPLSKYMDVRLVKMAYMIGTYMFFLGLGPFLWNPLSHSFGRRPLLAAGLTGSALTAIGCGLTRDYAAIMVFRSLNGLFAGASIGLGTVVISDLFFWHERGLYLGIYMVTHMSGGNLAPIIGGIMLKGFKLDWRWTFFVPAIAAAALLVVFAISVPETLYSRQVEALSRPYMTEYLKERIRKRRVDSRKLRLSNFSAPIKMLKYPSVSIPALFYSVASGFGHSIFIVTSAILFYKYYRFNAVQIGLLLGAPLTIGCWIGELGAGGVSDWIIRRRARIDGTRVPEDRLLALIPGVICLPVGLLMEAFALKRQAHWIVPGVGIGLASAGLQVVTTIIYAYTADCYSRQVAEVGAILNGGRQAFAFFLSFFAIPLALRLGLERAWSIFAAAEVVCFLPMIWLMLRGQRRRETELAPDWNTDL